jgi:hypothetical protein
MTLPRRGSTPSVEAERRRLRRIFALALAGALGSPALLYACSGNGSSQPVASGPDASMLDAASDAYVFPDSMFSFDATYVDRYEQWCDAGAPFPIAQGYLSCDFVDYSPCGLPEGAAPGGSGGIEAAWCEKICIFEAGVIGCEVFAGSLAPVDGGYTLIDGAIDPMLLDAALAADVDAAGAAAGPMLIECDLCASGGRRPAGYRPPRLGRRGAVADYFARMADLERASVMAFVRLREELRAHGASGSLVREASRAALDEVRHARVVARLARRYGAAPRSRTVAERRDVRPLEEVAIENAVEGCVRETYGALVATWQGRAAADPSVARAMRRIARDETRHAALAWAVARWAEARLSRSACRRVDEARRTARASLGAELTRPNDPALVRAAGLPSARRALAMFERAGEAFG